MIKPAVVTVGDELVLGERRNDNQEWLLQSLRQRANPAEVAMVLPDSVTIIATWLKLMISEHCFPILVSGGIGGTHDDCTREGISVALKLPLIRHEACFAILAAKYGQQFTSGRQRMALLPEGCELIANPLGAPGFFIGGVYAFPGFPTMLQPMATQVLDELMPKAAEHAWLVRDYQVPLSEGLIAWDVEAFVKSHGNARIGLYPHSRGSRHEVSVRLRYHPQHPEVVTAFEQLLAAIKHKHKTSD